MSGGRFIFNDIVFIQSYMEETALVLICFYFSFLTSGQHSFIPIFTLCMHQYNMAVEIPYWN